MPAASPIPPPSSLPIVPDPAAYGLDAVKDVEPLAPDESGAYYGLLHHAQSVPEDALWQAGKAFVAERERASRESTFRDMLHNPEAWRGRPAVMYGHILQTVEYDALDNPYGIKKLYESALYTDDAAHHPTTVVFLERPPELPLGTDMVPSVGVAGYFLKMYVYPSSDMKSRKAPLILARTVHVFPPQRRGPIFPPAVSYGGLLFLLAALVYGVWRGFRKDRQRVVTRRQQELDQNQPDFGKLS
jgi:hypothetical protein